MLQKNQKLRPDAVEIVQQFAVCIQNGYVEKVDPAKAAKLQRLAGYKQDLMHKANLSAELVDKCVEFAKNVLLVPEDKLGYVDDPENALKKEETQAEAFLVKKGVKNVRWKDLKKIAVFEIWG